MLSLSVSRFMTTGFLAFGLAVPVALSQTEGSIAGTIAGDDGKPVAAAVIIQRTTLPVARAQVPATAIGTFAFSSLPAGTYMFCAVADGYLDPCTWSIQPPTVQLADGQAVTGFKLVVKKGAKLQVHLNDPDKILSASAVAKPGAPHVVLGIFTPGHTFVPLTLVGTDATGQNYQATVPVEQSVTSLYINGRNALVLDQTGAQVASTGTSVAVAPASAAAPKTITFTVRDPNKH